MVRTVVEQCAYVSLQSAALLRDTEVPLNTMSHSRLLVPDPVLDETRGDLVATCRVDPLGGSRTGRTRRVKASCVITSASGGAVVAVGETLAGVMERGLYRAWRGPSVTRAGHLHHPPQGGTGDRGGVRARSENQVLSDLSRRPDGRVDALLRLPTPHRYLLPPPSDHVTGRLFAEATRQIVLAGCVPGAPRATVSALRLEFRHLCTLDGAVRIESGAATARSATARAGAATWQVHFRQGGTTVCVATAETLG
ncbi:AfsA-related hotdog domain-containing protein [Streptomyces sp. NPDC005012]|uniref:AfsA-related hotdog domain-containing protein n=1 Tax=unclassified Streptomyces TaxID=2593676 RepID=UPI0033AFBD94